MRGIDINITCTVLLKYERVGSEEQEIILVWPNEDMIFFLSYIFNGANKYPDRVKTTVNQREGIINRLEFPLSLDICYRVLYLKR